MGMVVMGTRVHAPNGRSGVPEGDFPVLGKVGDMLGYRLQVDVKLVNRISTQRQPPV